MLGTLLNLPALLLLVAVNSSPVVIAWLLRDRYSWPIDLNVYWSDHRPIFGAHKTWRGLIVAVLVGAGVGSALSIGWHVGSIFAMLALAGDLLSSFVKRRLGQPNGGRVPLIDQLPEALLPMIGLRSPLGLNTVSLFGTAAVFTVLDLIFSRLRPQEPRRQ